MADNKKIDKKEKGRPKIYTLKFCIKEFEDFLKKLEEDTEYSIITFHDLIKDKPYSKQRISEWEKEHGGNEVFSELRTRTREELENRLFKIGLANKANAQLVKFGLQNHYGWKEKSETDITTGGEKLSEKEPLIINIGGTKIEM